MARDFHDRFQLPIASDEARRRFINRALNDVFSRFFGVEGFFVQGIDFLDRAKLESNVVSSLGEVYLTGAAVAHASKSFLNCLLALESLHHHLGPWPQEKKFVANAIERLLSESETDLGVSWDGQAFRLSGAAELDQALVNEPLRWIRPQRYETVRAPFTKGLQHYLESIQDPAKLADVVTDAYEAMEAMAKIVTRRPQMDLSANAELFISKIGVSEAYKKILKEYISYAQSFRHAAPQESPRPTPVRRETESFLYLTGIFLRLAIQHLEGEEPSAA